MRILWVVVDLTGPTEGDVVTVAETPETPTPSLAERDTGDLADDIEAWADVDASNLRSGSRVTSAEQLMGREPDLRAAAAQLRQLDRIKAPDVVAEVTQRVAEMRGIAKMIEADPHGIANEDDVWQWRRDAALLAAAYLDEPDALEADDGA